MNMKKTRHRDSAKNARKRKTKKPRKADTADKYRLYEQSVQSTDFEYEFVDSNFRRLRGRTARTLREDFCGTAQMCCEWVRGRPDNRAIGVDLDPEVLAWSREHHIAALTAEQQQRVRLLQEDVRKVSTEPVDMVLAMNFSWQIFEQREVLCDYFRSVRDSLVDDGVLFMDAFGGYEAYQELEEKTRHKGFTYVWEQASYDPVTGHMVCHIHFHFGDGSKIRKAFSYEWRLYGLPELKEILLDAGFSNVTIYWQGWDEDDEPDGVFEPTEHGEADPGWICMISAEK
ncbi:MAG TPA: class I SAM-dependent methyltransferase [Gammaproteobacteria bacterium]|nr:class I SAM-dependent methyltransferase [Gammaproteobacteria bacterium]